MGQKYLIDTNVVIDYLGNNIPGKGSELIDGLPVLISVITRMEILGWYGVNSKQLEKMNSFIITAQTFLLEEAIILKTIEIRQQHKIKLPDAIIAATALELKLTLLSRNTKDFENIAGLQILNPWNL
jgi:predicted nucleic acid-binding protein